MKFVALVSGGKDSCYNILHCLAQGHELVALLNLYPQEKDEIDSFMFQTVGHDIIDYYEECTGIPVYREPITGTSKNQTLEYDITEDDEIEDLYRLLSRVQVDHPDIKGVSVGAILSSYQRTRVENVCSRLGLISLAFLWQRDQKQLMSEMCQSGLDARIIKVAAMGLSDKHLGMSIRELFPVLLKLNQSFDVHICGEGGEFETLVLDAPFFKKRLTISHTESVKLSNDDVCYLKLQARVTEKDTQIVDDWKKEVIIPPLLLDKFEKILDSLPKAEPNCQTVSMIPGYDPVFPSKFEKVGNKFFFSNIISTEVGLEAQCKSIFFQVSEKLGANNLSYANIQSATLLVAAMSDFAEINKIYCEYFKKPLPPSRICVGTSLPNNSHLQLSVTILPDISKKTGLHVQGRSYWAPPNIGPYSQAIIDEDNVATLAGQIPLVPASTELYNDEEMELSTVLSLQHLDNVKSVIGCTTNISIVSYVTDLSHISSVQKVWSEYEHVRPECLVIVQVSMLPRNAKVEWGGLSYKEIRDMYYDSDEEEEYTAMTKAVQDKLGLNQTFVKVNDVFFNTMFFNLQDIRGDTFGPEYHYQVYSRPDTISQVKQHLESISVEYIPVFGAWDYQGKSFDLAVLVRGKI